MPPSGYQVWQNKRNTERIVMSDNRISQHSPSSSRVHNNIMFVDRHVIRASRCLSRRQHLPLASISPKPNNSTKLQNFAFAKGLVKISAGLSSVGIYTTDNFPSSIASRMK